LFNDLAHKKTRHRERSEAMHGYSSDPVVHGNRAATKNAGVTSASLRCARVDGCISACAQEAQAGAA
jgi:hypothetical protein